MQRTDKKIYLKLTCYGKENIRKLAFIAGIMEAAHVV